MIVVTRLRAWSAPSTAFGGPPPPLRGRGSARVATFGPLPFTGDGDHAKRGGGGGPRSEGEARP